MCCKPEAAAKKITKTLIMLMRFTHEILCNFHENQTFG